jgi:hypothetical protein
MSHRSALRLLGLIVLIAATPAVAGESDCLPATVCFTPGGNCTDMIVQAFRRRPADGFGAGLFVHLRADRQGLT